MDQNKLDQEFDDPEIDIEDFEAESEDHTPIDQKRDLLPSRGKDGYELRQLLHSWIATGNVTVRDDFIRACEPIISRVAKSLMKGRASQIRVDLDDLLGEGRMELWRLLQDNKTQEAQSIEAYVGGRVKQIMKEYIQTNRTTETLPARTFRRYASAVYKYDDFRKQGSLGAVQEQGIISALGYKPSDMPREISRMRSAIQPAYSLDMPMKESSSQSFLDLLPGSEFSDPAKYLEEQSEEAYRYIYARMLFENADLNRMEKYILYHRIFGPDGKVSGNLENQADFAKSIGLVPTALHQYESKALEKMRVLDARLKNDPSLYKRLYNQQILRIQKGQFYNLEEEPPRGLNRTQQIQMREAESLRITIDQCTLPCEFLGKLYVSKQIKSITDDRYPLFIVGRDFEIEDDYDLDVLVKPWKDGGFLGVLIPESFDQEFFDAVNKGNHQVQYFSITDLKMKGRDVLDSADQGHVIECENKQAGFRYYYISAKVEDFIPYIKMAIENARNKMIQAGKPCYQPYRVIQSQSLADERSSMKLNGHSLEAVRMGSLGRHREKIVLAMQNHSMPLIVLNKKGVVSGILVNGFVADRVFAERENEMVGCSRIKVDYHKLMLNFSEFSQQGQAYVESVSEKYNARLCYFPADKIPVRHVLAVITDMLCAPDRLAPVLRPS